MPREGQLARGREDPERGNAVGARRREEEHRLRQVHLAGHLLHDRGGEPGRGAAPQATGDGCTACTPFSLTARWHSTHQPMVSLGPGTGMAARFITSFTGFCPVFACTCSIASMRPWQVWQTSPAWTWFLCGNCAYSGILKIRTHEMGCCWFQ